MGATSAGVGGEHKLLPLGSVGMLPHRSWLAGTWCSHGTAERHLQGAELMPMSGTWPACCWSFPWLPQELLRFCPMAAVLPPNEGMIPPEMNNEALGGLKLPLPGDAQATAGGKEEEVTVLRVFSYCKFPRGLEERRRVGVEKHPFSPCFAHPVLLLPSKPVRRASSSCLLLLFHTKSVHRYCCQF